MAGGGEWVGEVGWRRTEGRRNATGGGTGRMGMGKALEEREELGLIGPERPRRVAVQAEGCASIVRAFDNGEEHAPRWEDAHTVAAGIRVPKAIGDFLILRAVRASGGFDMAVSNAELSITVDENVRYDGFILLPEDSTELGDVTNVLRCEWVGPKCLAWHFD